SSPICKHWETSNKQMTKRIAIIVQRYGEEVNGGAELHARWLAEQLTSLAEVHAITTCAIDYTTWADEYPAGDSVLNGVIVHRFPVDQARKWGDSQRKTGHLLLREHSLFEEMTWMKEQGPYSSALLAFIQESAAVFDAFIFFTYLYATTYFGLPLVAEKAILVPTAHDEPFLYMPLFRSLFHLPRLIAFNTEPERELVQRVTGNGRVQSTIAGIGINVPDNPSATAFRNQFGITDPFLLYVGRIHPAKNVAELIDDFLAFRQVYDQPLKLVLAGKSHIDLPQHPDIVPIGFVSEQEKFNAIQAAEVVLMPSKYESLSMIVLEAWLMGKPVLVNGRCQVLRYQCQQSNGGLYYNTTTEFIATLQKLLQSPNLRAQLGEQGRKFTQARYHWNVILSKYQTILNNI
ncbi:MAG: glycosyltransferase family 4 protein, partial [Anaerolineales bacterium]|nr:glycosyltransferase family 4 protein [Anaerolineales bacterium]